VPSAQKQKPPVTLPPGLNAKEKKDAGLIGRVLDTTPKFAELVANRAASGQLSSKQLNDLAYIAKQGQVHGRTDQQVITSLEKAMKGMLPNTVPARQNQGSSGRPSPNSEGSPSIGKGLGQQLGALLNYDIGDALVQRVNTAGIQWATARGNQELAQFLKDDLAAHNHLKEVGLAGAAGEMTRALPGEFQNGWGQYSVGSIAAGVGNLSGLGNAKGLMTGTDFKGRPVNKYQGALNIGLGTMTGVVGRSNIGKIGQATTRTLNTVSAKGNQMLDTIAYGLFGGGPGSGPALAYAGGGVGGAALNGGRQLAQLPEGLGPMGVVGADFMAKKGKPPSGSASTPKTGVAQTVAPRQPVSTVVPKDGLTFEDSAKHHQNSQGNASKPPANPQSTLNTSIQIKGTSSRRVGVDTKTGEFAVFDETHNGQGIYHGHIRSWDELTDQMKVALEKAGLVDRRGRIIK
jgi:hypothetical protein